MDSARAAACRVRDGWPQRGRAPGERSSRWERGEAGFGTVLDPTSLSVADFMATAAAARAGTAAVPGHRGFGVAGDGSDGPGDLDAGIVLAQAGPPRGSRPSRAAGGAGGGVAPQTSMEEFRAFRFNVAQERLRRAEPGNPKATVMNHPNRPVPSEAEVRAMEAEAEAAMARRRTLPALPKERQRAEPEPPKPSNDILFPGGNRLGVRLGSSGADTTTVTNAELEKLAADLMAGAVATPRNGYRGVWYTRADGVQFGFRFSPRSGMTIDVNGDSYALPFTTFRIHRFPWTE